MVANPDMGSHVVEQIESDDVLSVSNNLENQHVPAMTEDECVGPTVLGVELHIQVVGGVEDELV